MGSATTLMTPEDLDQIRAIVGAAEQRITERQDCGVEALTSNMSDLRSELTRRMEALERRIEVQAPVIISMDARMAAFTRAIDQVLTAHDSSANTQAAQQRAIEDPAARVAKLERSFQSSN